MSTPEAAVVAKYFGQRVRTIRESYGLSQRQLARSCGLEQPELADLERGEVEPGLYLIVRVATGLCVDPGELVRGFPPVRSARPPGPARQEARPTHERQVQM